MERKEILAEGELRKYKGKKKRMERGKKGTIRRKRVEMKTDGEKTGLRRKERK